MSSTPRTDEQGKTFSFTSSTNGEFVLSSFARELEIENQNRRSILNNIRDILNDDYDLRDALFAIHHSMVRFK